MINSLWLNTFKTLIEVGHFTQTAERLFMTQPGVSQHIKKLEESVGYPLITRFKKQFEITEQGRLLYDFACRQADQELALFESLMVDSPFRGHCSIACSGSVALSLFPKLLTLQQQHAELTIALEAAPNHKILNDIRDGNIEVGIVTQRPDDLEFNCEEIGRQNLLLIMPATLDQQLKHGSPKLIEALLSLGLIDHPDAMHYLNFYLDQCSDENVTSLNSQQLIKRCYINQLTQILTPVSLGLGFTVLPASALENFGNKESVVCHQPNNEVYETLYWVEKRHRMLPARYEPIKEQCRVLFT